MTSASDRQRLPLLVAIAVAAVLAVVALIVVVPTILPRPEPTPSSSPTPSAVPSPDASTPDGATRAFFAAVAEARRTGNAQVILEFTTGPESSAFLTIDGFVQGQRQAGKASVLTKNEIVDPVADITDGTATVVFTHRLEGFDIDLDSGEPLESPTSLPDRKVTVELKKTGGEWKVESFAVDLS